MWQKLDFQFQGKINKPSHLQFFLFYFCNLRVPRNPLLCLHVGPTPNDTSKPTTSESRRHSSAAIPHVLYYTHHIRCTHWKWPQHPLPSCVANLLRSLSVCLFVSVRTSTVAGRTWRSSRRTKESTRKSRGSGPSGSSTASSLRSDISSGLKCFQIELHH